MRVLPRGCTSGGTVGLCPFSCAIRRRVAPTFARPGLGDNPAAAVVTVSVRQVHLDPKS
jgi:hypothetical protein